MTRPFWFAGEVHGSLHVSGALSLALLTLANKEACLSQPPCLRPLAGCPLRLEGCSAFPRKEVRLDHRQRNAFLTTHCRKIMNVNSDQAGKPNGYCQGPPRPSLRMTH